MNTSLGRVFISYKRELGSRIIARDIYDKLTQRHYEVFLDKFDITGGSNWQEEIFDALHISDVLILLVEEKTSESKWVIREVGMAYGAHIAILPVSLMTGANTKAVLEDLGVERKQYIPWSDRPTDTEIDKLVEDIDKLSRQTRIAQNDWINKLQDKKWTILKANDNPSLAQYQLKNASHPCRLHLATGSMINISEMQHADVLVNTENDYMQMARVYERDTVSSLLRYRGSEVKGGRLMEDTIQDELNLHIKNHPDLKGRPIELGKVITTSAGHKNSKLRDAKSQIRFIIHAATVRVVPGALQTAMQPIDIPEDITGCVVCCLEEVNNINELRGVVSPKGNTQYKEQIKLSVNYQPIRSIVFPLFGAGRGKRQAEVVIGPMLDGIRHYLQQNPQSTLEDISICVFRSTDIEIVQDAFAKRFDLIPQT